MLLTFQEKLFFSTFLSFFHVLIRLHKFLLSFHVWFGWLRLDEEHWSILLLLIRCLNKNICLAVSRQLTYSIICFDRKSFSGYKKCWSKFKPLNNNFHFTYLKLFFNIQYEEIIYWKNDNLESIKSSGTRK